MEKVCSWRGQAIAERVSPLIPQLTCCVCFQGTLPFGHVSSPSSARFPTSGDRTLCAMTSQAGSTRLSPTFRPGTPPRSCSSQRGGSGQGSGQAGGIQGAEVPSPLRPCGHNNTVSESQFGNLFLMTQSIVTQTGAVQCLPGASVSSAEEKSWSSGKVE